MIDIDVKAEIWDAEQSYFAAHAAKKHVPMFGTFEITPRCNFNCKMCYIHMTPKDISSAGRGELTARQWLHLAEEALENETLNLLLTGGEPLLRSDFEEIYTEICKMGFLVFLNTNGSLMDKRYYNLFSRYPPTAVAVTLYGADGETYQNVCGNAEWFGKTVNGLEMLAEIPTYLEVRTTFIKDNKDQLDRLREIASIYTKRYAINNMVFKPVPGVASSVEQCRLSAKECFDIAESNAGYYRELRRKEKEEKAVSLSFEGIKKKDKKRKYTGLDVPPEILTCLAAKAMYFIRWDGTMLPCGTFAAPYCTYPLEEGFKEAWDRLPGLFKDLKHPKKCLKCDYYYNCPNCPAYFQMETGAYDEAADYICAMAAERSNRNRYEALTSDWL